MGILYTEVEKAGFNLPLTQVYCHYLLPARYDDMVEVETDIEYLKRASMKFTYLIWDENREISSRKVILFMPAQTIAGKSSASR